MRLANGQTCQIKGVYRPMQMMAGGFAATLNYEASGFYSDALAHAIVRTDPFCFQFRYFDPVVGTLLYGGSAWLNGLNIGTVRFGNGGSCNVTGIYALQDLR